MSVKKPDFTYLRKNNLGYTVLPNLPLQAICEANNGEALAIWTYLISKPEDWKIYKTEVAETLGFGRVKFAKAVRLLKKLGLWKTIRLVDSDGKVTRWETEISTDLSDEAMGERYGVNYKRTTTITQNDGNVLLGPKPEGRLSTSTETTRVENVALQKKDNTKERLTTQKKDIATGDKPPPKTNATFEAYSLAYQQRYQCEPTRNASVNGKLSQFIDRVGAADAPAVAQFYVRHHDPWYAKQGHQVGAMLQHAEKLHMEWKTGRDTSEMCGPDKPPTKLQRAERVFRESQARRNGGSVDDTATIMPLGWES